MRTESRSAIVVGGGIVGLAAAYKLARAWPGTAVTVLEKESEVARHQSGNNSGVLHAGLYYAPGSAKARLAVDGLRQMRAFCEAYGVAHEVCGKLVVATDDAEVPRLKALLDRGTQNGLRDLAWLTPAEMREVEPHAAGAAAVHVPEEGIVDYPGVCQALVHAGAERGVRVITAAEVRALRREGRVWVAETRAGELRGAVLVNCAGLHSDRVAAMAGGQLDVKIVPFRGQYYTLRPERRHLVRHLIYPVPDPAFPFLGVHFTRRVQGEVEAGPNAVLALGREGYRWADVNVRDLADALSYPGLWRFVARHPRASWAELRRSFSRELFCHALQRLVPAVEPDDLAAAGAGVRAQAMRANGELVQDFAFVDGPGAVHVLNAPSPAATASLAIADEIVRRVTLHLA